MCVRVPGGAGMSRFAAYHGRSRSRNVMSWPRAPSWRTSARYVVACPLPHDEVIESPRMTICIGVLRHRAQREERLQLLDATFVGMFRQYSRHRRVANAARDIRPQALEDGGDFVAAGGGEHLASRLEEQLDAFPRIRDEARAGARGFKHPRRGRKPVPRHAV